MSDPERNHRQSRLDQSDKSVADGGHRDTNGSPGSQSPRAAGREETRRRYAGRLREALEAFHEAFQGVQYTNRQDLKTRIDGLSLWDFEASQIEQVLDGVEHLAEQRDEEDLLQLVKAELGFPKGDIDHILSVSDPPFYTACPNPFLTDFISDAEDDGAYSKEPFADDVSAGKGDPAYKVHSYPTKVPPKAITPLIEHYAEPGGVVLDPFCGTGMTGVAGSRLNFPVNVVLQDISPCATHIAGSLRFTVPPPLFEERAKQILADVEEECGWMYQTRADGEDQTVRYFVWSDVYLCSSCGRPVQIWQIEGENSVGGLKEKNPCPHCDAEISKSDMEPQLETYFDSVRAESQKRIRRELVMKVYMEGNRSQKVDVDAGDVERLEKIRSREIPYDVPTAKMLFKDGNWGDQWRSSYHTGVTQAHHFYTKRNLWILSAIWDRIGSIEDSELRGLLRLWFTASLSRMTRMNRYMAQHERHVGPLAGTLFIGPIQAEISPFYFFNRKIRNLKKLLEEQTYGAGETFVSTNSSTWLPLPSDSVDYIFTDPPFGSNLAYSELNFLVESWLGSFTNQEKEAIVSDAQEKTTSDFQSLITGATKEAFRVLKPGRWMTLEFHNSQSSIWAAIQEALLAAGFVVADVRTLDKKKGTTKQHTQPGTVKQDLIISAYKPSKSLEEDFSLHAGTEEGVWDFVKSHLEQLPVWVSTEGGAETIAERQAYLLFDRMVAFHVQRGLTVPLPASDFYRGLDERFSERDGMYFLPAQAEEYDKKRMSVTSIQQLQLTVTDEASAIQWLRQRLREKPQSFQGLHPDFMKAVSGWKKHEERVELKELLEQNFLQYDGAGEVPPQIHSYLSSNFKTLRNLSKTDSRLQEKAEDRWYVPDPRREGDLERMREKALVKEFEELAASKGRVEKLRTEACRIGFKKLWNDGDYESLLAVARRLPGDVIEEDPNLLMYRDLARQRVE